MKNGGSNRSNEEQEMEEFFELIRRFHEARSLRKRELMLEMGVEEDKKQEEAIKKKAKIKRVISEDEENERPSNWALAFQWEDFTQEISNKPGDYGTIIVNDDNCQQEGENDDLRDLDLNLAL